MQDELKFKGKITQNVCHMIKNSAIKRENATKYCIFYILTKYYYIIEKSSKKYKNQSIKVHDLVLKFNHDFEWK